METLRTEITSGMMSKSEFIVHFKRGGGALKNSTWLGGKQIEISKYDAMYYCVDGKNMTLAEMIDAGLFYYHPVELVIYIDNPEDRIC